MNSQGEILEVIWDGAHAGHDEDLLLTAGIAEKRQGRSGSPRDRLIGSGGGRKKGRVKAQHDLQEAIRAYLERGATPTSGELAEAMSATAKDICTATQRLMRIGAIHSTPIPRARWQFHGWQTFRVRYQIGRGRE